MADERFKHTQNSIGMQFIRYDDKHILMGTFADADGIAEIVKLLNQQEKLAKKDNDKINELHWENHQLTTQLEQIQQTIQEAYKTERTELGRSVLKQLLEAIQ